MRRKKSCLFWCFFVSFLIFFPAFTNPEQGSKKLSKPQYEVKAEFNVPVLMRDGVKLSADVYRPDAEGQFPVLLTRTYYGKCNRDIFHSSGKEFIEYFVSRGYVVVIQDCRGRYDSEGKFYIEIYDAEDGYDTYEWCGSQPWSNGKIGTYGCSYGGCIQWYSAHLRNSHLKCMVPRDATSDSYFDGGFMRGGVYQGWLGWCVGTAGGTGRQGRREGLNWKEIYMNLPLNEADESIGFHFPWWKDYFKHPIYDEYWKRTSVHNKYHLIEVPSLNIGGWYSSSDIMGTIRNFLGVFKKGYSEQGRKNQKLFIGPWSHCSSSTKVGEIDFGPQAKVDFNELHLRWYDHWLKGIDTGIMDTPPIKIFVMGMNDWITAADWPLPETQFTKFFLHSGGRANSLIGDGTLNITHPNSEPVDRFTYDPAHPVPSSTDSDLLDQRPMERRDDVLVYTSEPLKEDLMVVGPVKVILYAASSAVDTDFTGKLVDVHPNDLAQGLNYGIVRARYRDSFEKPTLIEPGKIYKYEIDLWATGNLFKKGRRIRLEISSSNFPGFLPNTNTGNDIGSDTERKIARQIIYHDAEHPSHLVLPIIPDNRIDT
ncbi:MAG TPA: CocE/NonD family hydrolase [Acidobacteriota bacterium]|nr:CocE/NonD family hydrolase [Acidobacteriota bacterium]